MTVELISSRNIRNYKDSQQITIKKGIIVTPSAKDIARELGIKIVYEEDDPERQKRDSSISNSLEKALEVKKPEVAGGRDNPDSCSLENIIETIVRDTLSLKNSDSVKGSAVINPERIVLMINFSEDNEIYRRVVSYIFEKGFIIKQLNSFSTSGIQFINMIADSPFFMTESEKIINSLKDNFKVNVLLS
jgi:hypothetical protein